MLELKRKAIIISLGFVTFLLIGILGCVPNRLGRPGSKTSKAKEVNQESQNAVKNSIPQTKDKSTADSITLNKVSLSDTLARKDSLAVKKDSSAADTLKNPDDLEFMVKYDSEDSTISEVELKQVHLYKNAVVTYGDINLKANYIRLNWITNEVYATGTYDSTAKKTVGDPIFQDGQQAYNTKEIRYNFKTKKAIIKGIVTAEGDGNIRGERVKKDTAGNFYIHHAMYTTCNLSHPHYYINAPKIKMVNQKQVISGPFNMVIGDVPLPIGLPFGFFPFPKKKEIGTSGVIIPTYGEEPNGRGFFLRDGGYYFAISEYLNAIVTGQIYTSGSWGLGVASTYTKRYRYNGNVALRFAKNKSSDEVKRLTGQGTSTDFSVVWSHAPQPRGNSTFSANVNVTSNNYNQNQSQQVTNYTQNVAASSVQYTKTIGTYMRGAASLRVNQNFGQNQRDSLGRERRVGGKTNVSSDFSFGVNQIAPFAMNGGRGRWYESFRLGMDFSGNYALTNVLSAVDTSYSRLQFKVANLEYGKSRIGKDTTIEFNMGNLKAMSNNAQFTGRYSIPISLPNFKLLKFINLTPSMSLNGEIFTKQYNYAYQGNNTVSIDTINKVGTEYSYSFGGGLNTRFYGTFLVRGRRVEAIRHTVIPSLSFSYTPDFTGDTYGFYQTVRINEKGDFKKLSKFRGVGNGVSDGRASSVMSFSLNNSLEMKLRSKSDTAAQQFEKVSLLDNFGIGGSYNLMADSLKLSTIAINANTRLGKNLNLNFNMNLDPYAYQANPKIIGEQVGTRVNKFAVTQGQGIANLQSLGFTLGTSFSPKSSSDKSKTTPAKPGENSTTQAQREFVQNNPELYVDYTIPWNVNLNYNFGLSKSGLMAGRIIQALQATGDLSLSKNFKISVSTGFDFAAFQPTITSFTLYRDLHCWDMSFSWTPFAGNASRASNYSFTLKVKSAILQDLKVTRRRSFRDMATY